MEETIIILDFGSQYTQLIARRIRELNIYCEIHPFNKIPKIEPNIKGLILSGSPASVRDTNPPIPNIDAFYRHLPVLGICYGAQLMVNHFKGEVFPSKIREYGRAKLNYIAPSNALLENVNLNGQVWMSHGDTIIRLPDNFTKIASTEEVEMAGYQIQEQLIFGLQFHPEVVHSECGQQILKNFAISICGCGQNWTASSFVDQKVSELQQQLTTDKVVLGLSGGVDSSVAAMLLKKAVGDKLYCIFVDNGLLRKNEFEEVLSCYQHLGLNVKGVNAQARFWKALEGINDPEEKRKIIGKVFIDVFDEEAHQIKNVAWLGQGTIYPDRIESVSVNGPSATIKSHHNVGGLPDTMNLKIVEPLSLLFKDEVRKTGKELGIPDIILERHPFPGPGLAIRILGEVTPQRVALLQMADDIYIKSLKEAGLYHQIWQAGAILLPVKSVGVMGDERTYENVVCLRAVTSTDGMTADWFQFPHDILANISNHIINKVKGINRVVYDISSKPPATIEWE